jgi:hypothetical protein
VDLLGCSNAETLAQCDPLIKDGPVTPVGNNIYDD